MSNGQSALDKFSKSLNSYDIKGIQNADNVINRINREANDLISCHYSIISGFCKKHYYKQDEDKNNNSGYKELGLVIEHYGSLNKENIENALYLIDSMFVKTTSIKSEAARKKIQDFLELTKSNLQEALVSINTGQHHGRNVIEPERATSNHIIKNKKELTLLFLPVPLFILSILFIIISFNVLAVIIGLAAVIIHIILIGIVVKQRVTGKNYDNTARRLRNSLDNILAAQTYNDMDLQVKIAMIDSTAELLSVSERDKTRAKAYYELLKELTTKHNNEVQEMLSITIK